MLVLFLKGHKLYFSCSTSGDNEASPYDFSPLLNSGILFTLCSYVCHAEVNAILNTNHASAEGQVSSNVVGTDLVLATPWLSSILPFVFVALK